MPDKPDAIVVISQFWRCVLRMQNVTMNVTRNIAPPWQRHSERAVLSPSLDKFGSRQSRIALRQINELGLKARD